MNTKGSKGNINFDLEELFKYINGGVSTIGMKTNSAVVKTIDSYVREFNSNNTWRKGAMNLRMLMQDNYDQGVADAEARAQKAIAKAEAKAKEEKACNVRTMYADNIPVDKIAKYVSLSEAEVRNIVSAK